MTAILATGAMSDPLTHQISESVRKGWAIGCSKGFALVDSIYHYAKYVLFEPSTSVENQKRLNEREWAPIMDKIRSLKEVMGIKEEIELWGENVFDVTPYGKFASLELANATYYKGKPLLYVNNLRKREVLTLTEEEQWFLIGHELSHIEHHDEVVPFYVEPLSSLALFSTAALLAAIFLSATPPTSSSWGTVILGGMGVTGLIISKIALSFFAQRKEKRADRDAFTSSKSAGKGGISFFKRVLSFGTPEHFRENIITRLLCRSFGFLFTIVETHPPIQNRIKYIQEWVKEAEQAVSQPLSQVG